MKIYELVVIDMATDEVLEERSYDYTGPVARCDLFGGGGQAKAAEAAGQVQAEAARYAADMQYKASRESNALTREMYQTGREDMAPWRLTGQMALDVYSGLLGLPSIHDTQMPGTGGAATAGKTGTAGTAGTAAGGAAAGYTTGTGTVGYYDPKFNQQPTSFAQAFDPILQERGVQPGDPFFGSVYDPTGGAKPSQDRPVVQIGPQLYEPNYPSWFRETPGKVDTTDMTPRDYMLMEQYQGGKQGAPPGTTYQPFAGDPSKIYSQGGGGTWSAYGGTMQPGAAGAPAPAANAMADYRSAIATPSDRIDAEAYLKRTPGYQWQLGQGVAALDRSAAAQGMALSGAQQQAVQEYGQNYALGHYETLMNRLGSLAGLGQAGAAQTGQWGMGAAGQMGANTMQAAQLGGQARMAGAEAIGSGYINAANARAADKNQMWNMIGTGIGIAAPLLLSDARAKEDIKPMIEGGLPMVLRLEPVSFRYRPEFGGRPVRAGFIADALAQLLPEAVVEGDDGLKRLDPMPLIALLVKAVQEQQQQISRL